METRDETVERVHPSHIRRGANPRSKRDPVRFAELKASIAEQGQIDPCICRDIVDDEDVELVTGEGRVLACEELGIEVAVIIRTMTAAEAHAQRVASNESREPLSIFDRARAAKVAIEDHGFTIESWAIRMGTSPRTVRQDLAILELHPFWAKALERDLVDEAGALAIAQSPAAVQADIASLPSLVGAIRQGVRIDKASIRDVLDGYRSDLRRAPFDTGDATLVPASGSCVDCPRRSPDSQLSIFSDITEPATCFYQPCFDAKHEASTERKVEASRKAGLLVLDTEKSNAALRTDSDYVRLDDPACWRDHKGKLRATPDFDWVHGVSHERTPVMWRELLRDVKPVLARVGRDLVELAVKSTAESARSRVMPPETTEVSGHDRVKPDKDAKAAARAKEKARQRGLDAVIAAVWDWAVTPVFEDDAVRAKTDAFESMLRAMIAAECSTSRSFATPKEVLVDLLRIRSWSREDAATGATDSESEAATKMLSTLKRAELHAMHAAIAMLRDRPSYENGVAGTAFEAIAKIAGVDIKHHLRAAEREAKGIAEPKKRRAKKAAQADQTEAFDAAE